MRCGVRILRGRKGYTIIELMVMFTILAVVSLVLIQGFPFLLEKSRDRRRRYDLSLLRHMVELYRADNGTYPIVPGGGWIFLYPGKFQAEQIPNPPNPPDRNFVPGVVPNYYETLPQDPNPGASTDETCAALGYERNIGYYSDPEGSKYKLISVCANEAGPISQDDPLRDPEHCPPPLCYAWAVASDLSILEGSY
jgi:general secretion pathway protein G